jgi:hypothetical protein
MFTALTSILIAYPRVRDIGEEVKVFIGISQYELDIVTKSDPSHAEFSAQVIPSLYKYLITYPVMTDPPLNTGGSQATLTLAPLKVVVTLEG